MRARLLLSAVLLVPALCAVGVPAGWADELPSQTVTAEADVTADDATDGNPGTGSSEVPETADPSTDVTTSEPAPTGGASEEPTATTTSGVADPSTGASSAADKSGGKLTTQGDKAQAAAAAQHDPRASVGDVDCSTSTVPVTLDNSRSTDATTFFVVAGDPESDADPAFDKSFVVAAGKTRVVSIPVTEDTEITILVGDDGETGSGPGAPLAFAFVVVDCAPNDQSHDPQARIGDVDCAAMTVPVTLDNSRSTDSTTFIVSAEDIKSVDPTFEQTFVVPAESTQVVQVPVTEDSKVVVGVGDNDVINGSNGEDGVLAVELVNVDCTAGDTSRGPRASVGDVRCATLTVPVTLDNTRSDTATDFEVLAGNPEAPEPAYDKTFHVAAGATKVVDVPAPNHAQVLVIVGDAGPSKALLTAEFVDVNCAPAPAPRPVPHVSGEQLPRTGGMGAGLPLVGLALLGGGAVLVGTSRRGSH